MDQKRLIVFASGSAEGGGSGFENLVKAVRENRMQHVQIVAVVSNHENGGVREKADRLGIPFEFMSGPFNAEAYQEVVRKHSAEFVALSGWLKLVHGLDSRTTFNIHPGPLPRFGGKGMYGHHVHEAVFAAYQAGELTESEVTIHFVTEKYDEGPVFFVCKVPIEGCANADELGARVNRAEHRWQPLLTEMIVSGAVNWDGKNKDSLKPRHVITLSYRDP